MSTTTAPVPGAATASPPLPPTTAYPLGWLRGVAALTVVVFHAYQHQRTAPEWQWPWSGAAHQAMLGTDLVVDLFFVLSGLVLWLPVARAAAEGRPGRPGRVLLYRRMARLLPLYLVVVTVVWAVSNPELPGHWQDLVLHLTMTHVYSDDYIFWTDGPAWSLAVEFHFYVLMALSVPVVQAAVRRAHGRGGRLVAVSTLPALCVVAGLGFYTWALVLTEQDPTDWSVWFSPISRAADFGIGMLLAVLAAAGIRLGGRVRALLAGGAVVATAALVMLRPATTTGEWWHPAYSLALAVGLASIVLHDGPWPRVLGWRPLVWVGGLGYGVYLLHEPVMRLLTHLGALPAPGGGNLFWVTAVMVAVPSVALAWVSSRTVEAAGLRVLATMTSQGRPRQYYPHLTTDEGPRT